MSMIEFAKYQSLENDFCIVGSRYSRFRWTTRRIAAFCHRRVGIGCDGLIVLGPPRSNGTRFRLYNADGSDAEWSGNGVRCAALFLVGSGRAAKVRLLTEVGPVELAVTPLGPGRSRVSFERPLPVARPALSRARRLTPNNTVGPIPVDAGNPHWIYIVPHFDFPWTDVGLVAQKLNRKTHGINVEFVRILNRRCFQMRIYERGVGPTPSSGSGALAAVAACASQRIIDLSVRVLSPGGEQVARVDRDLGTVRLTAVTHHVFTGVWESV